jgi:hypothetical protein
MEQHVRLVVLEHLSDELDVHVLHVDFLRYPVSLHIAIDRRMDIPTWRLLFKTMTASFSFSYDRRPMSDSHARQYSWVESHTTLVMMRDSS